MSDLNEDLIGYDFLVQESMRSIVRSVLERIVETGLPGEHQIYISFSTGEPGVDISENLRRQYPEEMTILLHSKFWDLHVDADFFSVRLSFDSILEKVVVPFKALTTFFDPSVSFGLQLGVDDEEKSFEHANGTLKPQIRKESVSGKVVKVDFSHHTKKDEDPK